MKARSLIHLASLAFLLASLFGPVGAQRALAGGGGYTFTVNTTSEGDDASPGNGYCATVGGECTLRAAIQESNALLGPDAIVFGLGGTGLHVITLSSVLPPIVDPLTIDGTTQPGCTVPCVELNGAVLGSFKNGLDIRADSSVVRGLVLVSFSNYAIQITGNGNKIEANYIGFRPGDTTPRGNGTGVAIIGASNVVGGTAAWQRNVISGNAYDGITVANGTSPATTGTIIRGNYIGTNAAGTGARANGATGIVVGVYATGTAIGGTVTGARNVISGNGETGISLLGAGTLVQGNFIGVRASGSGALGNGTNGVEITWGGEKNVVGGGTNAARNRIAFNGGAGVALLADAGTGNRIRHNWIYRNVGLGIDLNDDGVTVNDALDADTGPNDLQNYPVVGLATSATLTITGKLTSTPGSTYIVEFFSSPAGTCDATKHGEGQRFLGQKSLTTNVTGVGRFTFVSTVPFAVGGVITATATDAAGNTSEFSACRLAG